MNKTVILIPSLNPDEKLVEYVARLYDSGFDKIIVVNDGSAGSYDHFFDRAAENGRCTVLRHEVNKGKGAALKTGMRYYLEHFSGADGGACCGIVTGDADGQHSIEDTLRLAKRLESEQDGLILGCRDFSQDDVPARSRFGNRTTSVVFKLTHGLWVSDTQTGLRAIPGPLVEIFSRTGGERYEYEMNMLIECAERGIPIKEEKIKTIYIDDNSGSHFHAVRDSVRIYSVILRKMAGYCVSGCVSFALDLLLFWLMDRFVMPNAQGLKNALPTTIWLAVSTYASAAVARVLSSVENFYVNKRYVFKKDGDSAMSMVKYVALAVVLYFISSTAVAVLRNLFNTEATLIKMLTDSLLMLVSYTVQRKWVFRKDGGDTAREAR